MAQPDPDLLARMEAAGTPPAGGPFDAANLNRGQRRRAEAQQRAESRRVAAAQDRMQRSVDEGVGVLRAIMAHRLDIPVEHVGLVIEQAGVRAYDVRQVSIIEMVTSKDEAETEAQVEGAPV